MSITQPTLDSDLFKPDDENTVECPLCGRDDVKRTQLPNHIASDDCQTEHKEIRY